MTGWILSIIGIIFLGVLLDIIYPNGKTNAFCKGIFSILAVAVMIRPILQINFDKAEESSSQFVSEEILMSLQVSKEKYYKQKLEQIFLDNQIDGVNVEIHGNSEKNGFEIENIYIDTSELVLSKNITNINKYEVITNIILDSIDIDSERIIIYG